MKYTTYQIIIDFLEKEKERIHSQAVAVWDGIYLTGSDENCSIARGKIMDQRDIKQREIDSWKEEFKECVQSWVRENHSDHDGLLGFWGVSKK